MPVFQHITHLLPFLTPQPHGVNVGQALLALTLIIFSAKLGGEMANRLGQPPVLGELLAGVILGNLNLFGVTLLQPLRTNPELDLVAQIGAILLLFEVGVESDLAKLLSVGWSSLLVAFLGIFAPLVLGYITAALLLPGASWLTHLFIGGTLTATSVGITARVLKDLGKFGTDEARIILGAAIADDVIGLIVLAVITGLVTASSAGQQPENFRWATLLWIIVRALLFVTLAVIIGRFWSQRVFLYASRLRVSGALLSICIGFCFFVSALAAMAGLAPIVGAFAAGVVLEEVHYLPFIERGEPRIEELLSPINTVVVPVFFVVMGLRVDLSQFASANVLKFSLLITLVAVLGKQICGLGVLQRGINRIAIGIGMIPRGEVGLIFASLGATEVVAGRRLLTPDVFSGLVLMVILTTVITPPLLKLAFERKNV